MVHCSAGYNTVCVTNKQTNKQSQKLASMGVAWGAGWTTTWDKSVKRMFSGFTNHLTNWKSLQFVPVNPCIAQQYKITIEDTGRSYYCSRTILCLPWDSLLLAHRAPGSWLPCFSSLLPIFGSLLTPALMHYFRLPVDHHTGWQSPWTHQKLHRFRTKMIANCLSEGCHRSTS